MSHVEKVENKLLNSTCLSQFSSIQSLKVIHQHHFVFYLGRLSFFATLHAALHFYSDMSALIVGTVQSLWWVSSRWQLQGDSAGQSWPCSSSSQCDHWTHWSKCPVVTRRWSESMRSRRGGGGGDVTRLGIIRFKLWCHYVEASFDAVWTNCDWTLPLAWQPDDDKRGHSAGFG